MTGQSTPKPQSNSKLRRGLIIAANALFFLVAVAKLDAFVGYFGDALHDTSVERVTLTAAHPEKFGDIKALPQGALAPGTPFYLYFEPTRIAGKFENGKLTGRVVVDLELKDAQGKVVDQAKNVHTADFAVDAKSADRFRGTYVSLRFGNGLNLAEGRYTLSVIVHDQNSGKTARGDLAFEMKAAQPVAQIQPVAR